MARIDMNKTFVDPDSGETKNKTITSLNSAADQAAARLTTAAQYVRQPAQQRQLDAAKARGAPLGGADPVSHDKAVELSELTRRRSNPNPFQFPTNMEMPKPPQQPQKQPIPGVGSAFPVNQRVAGGTVQNLRQANEAVEAAKQDRPPVKPEEKTAVVDAAAEDIKREAEALEDARFAEQRQDMDEIRKILYSPERRRLIESRLSPINFESMILDRGIIQKIPIIPGKFSLTLRTLQHYENLHCLKKIQNQKGPLLYLEELLSTYKLTCSIVEVNDILLPEHRNNAGTYDESIDEQAFDLKLEYIKRLPVAVIAEASVQYDWFILRVNSCLSVDAIKNG